MLYAIFKRNCLNLGENFMFFYSITETESNRLLFYILHHIFIIFDILRVFYITFTFIILYEISSSTHERNSYL